MSEREEQKSTEKHPKRPSIWVGRVISVEDHPNAKYMWVAQVDVPYIVWVNGNERWHSGPDTRYTIVFGGNRELEPNDLVPVALPGAVLPSDEKDGKKVRARNWRGIRSEGMLLSSDELGWTIGGPDEVAVLDFRIGEAGERLAGPDTKVFGFSNSYYASIRRRSAAIYCAPPNLNRDRKSGSPITTYRVAETPMGHIRVLLNEHLLQGPFNHDLPDVRRLRR